MLAYNAPLEALQTAAKKVGVAIREHRHIAGNSYRFRLGLESDKRWQRRSSSGFNPDRKVNAVCWHGHRDFFRELFKLAPDARVQTAKTKTFSRGNRFYTAENFERIYHDTDRNIGSMMYPVSYSDACRHDQRGVAE